MSDNLKDIAKNLVENRGGFVNCQYLGKTETSYGTFWCCEDRSRYCDDCSNRNIYVLKEDCFFAIVIEQFACDTFKEVLEDALHNATILKNGYVRVFDNGERLHTQKSIKDVQDALRQGSSQEDIFNVCFDYCCVFCYFLWNYFGWVLFSDSYLVRIWSILWDSIFYNLCDKSH